MLLVQTCPKYEFQVTFRRSPQITWRHVVLFLCVSWCLLWPTRLILGYGGLSKTVCMAMAHCPGRSWRADGLMAQPLSVCSRTLRWSGNYSTLADLPNGGCKYAPEFWAVSGRCCAHIHTNEIRLISNLDRNSPGGRWQLQITKESTSASLEAVKEVHREVVYCASDGVRFDGKTWWRTNLFTGAARGNRK